MKSIIALACALPLMAQAHLIGKKFPDRTTNPLIPFEKVELVVETNFPPGNVSVSPDNRVFMTYHPTAKPDIQVAEIVNGKTVPFPNLEYQSKRKDGLYFQSILSIRVDRFNRLWVLDYADFGFKQPRLLAFDLKDKKLVHSFDFPKNIVGVGSMLNDFNIDAKSEKIYLADNSIFAMKPGIIVYDVATKKMKKVLTRHESTVNQGFAVRTEGKTLIGSHIFHGLDPIALDRKGEWFYYGPLNGEYLFRISVADLNNESLTEIELENRVQKYAEKTMSDGITMDNDGNIYLTDMEHSAIVRLTPDKKLETLVKNKMFRWPDGFSFGNEGWLYFTCGAIQDMMLKSKKQIQENGPYQIYRFKPGAEAYPGH